MAINNLPKNQVSEAVRAVDRDPRLVEAARFTGLYDLLIEPIIRELAATVPGARARQEDPGSVVRRAADVAVATALATLAKAEELTAAAEAAALLPDPKNAPTLFDGALSEGDREG